MATNAEKLVEAEAAYHNLMVNGAIRVVVDQNGERVEYTSVNAANLLRYIADLRNLIAAEAGLYVPRGPLGVIF
jgi:predicted TPR repeat methyltransferase